MFDDPRRQIEETLREHKEQGDNNETTDWQESIGGALAALHEADIADLLESLPQDERATVWQFVPQGQLSDVLLEVSESLCKDLIALTPTDTMVAVLREMEGDDVASLMRTLPKNNAVRLMRLSDWAGDQNVRASLSFQDDTVGALMDFQLVLAREEETVGDIRLRLQTLGELPGHCDKLFVVDDWERLAGVLPLKRLLLNKPETTAGDIMVSHNLHTFDPDDDVEKAAGAFERYDLITAPVLDEQHKIIGRLTIDEILDHMHSMRGRNLLSSAGVTEEEDLFASVPRRFGNRWRWLFVNLIAAFFISRVVGLFEETIEQVVALAALMPIVAGMSGNIGNQTATLTIRALALGYINPENWRSVVRKEALLSILNGVLWGGLVALFAYALYNRADLSIVLIISMTLCFLSGATAGFAVPMVMQRIGRDPALGTTVIISAVTDTLGFFIFLGMGYLFLL